ncbi:MAG: Rpn family recombination-promoting nuclease/putative transposase [Clostridiales Family XIII bacterium]|jgi:predicted transposase/invertase (TIGR01784 family)|nr:Rpn family recombination-promoting nuclease/putative transposase [Clostridiales Family XIII bacterium]
MGKKRAPAAKGTTELRYKLTNDILFKMVFVQHPELLRRLVAELLGIPYGNITEFEVTNAEIPPDLLGDKFCRLDVNMKVDGRRVDLEVQVADEHDYAERSLYLWAREYSSALQAGHGYAELPRVVVLSIVDFPMFDAEDFHSEFLPLEAKRGTPLTDRMSLHYFELPKIPEPTSADGELKLWLALFGAKTEEDIMKIQEMDVPVMEQAIGAYRAVSASDEFREMERLRDLARHNEASALANARREATADADAKWQGVVADKDAALADKDAALADKDAAVAEQAAIIAELRAQLGKDK